MSQTDKPSHSSKAQKAAARPAQRGTNRIADLDRDRPRAAAQPDTSLQPPRSDAPAGTPAGAGNGGSRNQGTRDYDIQGKPAARAATDTEPRKPAPRAQSRAAATAGAVPGKPTQPASTQQNTHMPEAKSPDNTVVSDTSRGAHDTEKKKPSLSFAQGRPPFDSSPGQRPDLHDATGNANLTSHINDPAMRRAPPGSTAREAEGGGHSDVSPLARDGATPAHEDARRAQDAHDADQRARMKGLTPREDVQGWHQAEGERQSDLPGRPRKI